VTEVEKDNLEDERAEAARKCESVEAPLLEGAGKANELLLTPKIAKNALKEECLSNQELIEKWPRGMTPSGVNVRSWYLRKPNPRKRVGSARREEGVGKNVQLPVACERKKWPRKTTWVAFAKIDAKGIPFKKVDDSWQSLAFRRSVDAVGSQAEARRLKL